ncbi:DoxX family protein [Spirosoma validum]|uniref:DoxX family protein n=1 Tax=Spirosoma validum TaxID=2771355 RepID=A0A927B6L8_9BACT|nr:DoxX family protein [Spirosoma validum]MBD2756651.1 DoxX family protein [Spirosoma validum]
MANQQKSFTVMHVILWVVQIILAASLVWAAWMKLAQPIDNLSTMWPWTGQIPATLVRLTGIVDLAGAVGLILPSLLRIQPTLTPIAAVALIVLMLCASIFHIVRGEASVIGVNVVFALLAAFVAWGRFTKVPIATK